MAGKGVPKLGGVEVKIGGTTHKAEEFHTTPQKPVQPPAGTGKVTTSSAIQTAAESRVHSATEQFAGTGIRHSTEKTEISSEVGRSPRTVEAVKTGLTEPTPAAKTPISATPLASPMTGQRTARTVEAVKTPMTGKGAVTSPGITTTPGVATSPLTGQRATGNVQTGSGISTAAENRVQGSTESFFGTDAQVGGKTTITSEVSRTPRTVEAVKTTMTGKDAQTLTRQPTPVGATPGVSSLPQTPRTGTGGTGSRTTSPGITTTPGVATSPLTGQRATGNVQTGSGISTAAESRVQGSTESFFGTDAQVGGKTTITSEVSRTPRTVEAVKTTLTGKIPQATMQGAAIPGVRTAGRGSAEERTEGGVTSAGVQGVSHYPTGRLTVNAVTGSMLTTAQRLRTANQVGSGYKVGHLTTSGMNISGTQVKNALSRMSGMMLGYGTAATVAGAVNGGGTANPSVTLDIPGMTTGNSGKAFNLAGAVDGAEAAGAAHGIFANPTGLKDNILGMAQTGLVGLQGKAMQAQDLGTESIGEAISLGQTAYMTFRAAQKVAEYAPQAGKQIVKVGSTATRAVYEVATTAGKATLTLAKSTAAITRGYDVGGKVSIRVPKDLFQVLKRYSLQTGLNKTAISRTIVHRVQSIKTGFYAAKGRIKTGYAFAKSSVKGIVHQTQRGVKIVHGITKGTVSVAAVRRGLAGQIRTAAKGIKTRVKTGIATGAKRFTRGVIRGGGMVFKNVPRGILTVGKAGKFGIKNASLFGAGLLTSTDNYALQGLGHTINAAHIGVKTSIQAGKLGGKAAGYSVKTAYKTARGARTAYSFIKNNGLKAAYDTARRKIGQKLVEAGKSIISAVINLVKTVGMKVAVPLLLIIVIAGGFTTAISVPVTAVGAILGGVFNFDGEGDDIEVNDYLADPTIGVPVLLPARKEEIKDEIEDALNDTTNNDIIRFRSDLTGLDTFLDISTDASGNIVINNFDNAFPTQDQTIAMLQPLFNAVILMDYDLAPSTTEAKDLMEYMFSKMFTLTDEDTTEYCGQNLLTGEGTADTPCGECGSIHAHSDCPNSTSGTHSSYTCPTCCYYYCAGHDYTDDCIDNGDGTYSCPGHTEYRDDDCAHACTGYTYCNGHKVKTFTLAIDGIYTLVDEYFQEPIDTLSAIPEASRTEAQNRQLQNLKDYLEIFWEMVNQLGENYGFNMSGNLSVSSLAGVTFLHGTRKGCQEVVDTALGQVGQSGGRPFWTYYGFTERVEWCACFVHWCMRHTPYASPHYPNTSNNAGCVAVSEWFKSHSQWANRGTTDLVAGDTIFFDWEGDGVTDHIGIVIGTDGSTVYTVEGNSGDEVKINTYGINASVIYGYGLMDYD